jgi:hypothetical protein
MILKDGACIEAGEFDDHIQNTNSSIRHGSPILYRLYMILCNMPARYKTLCNFEKPLMIDMGEKL